MTEQIYSELNNLVTSFNNYDIISNILFIDLRNVVSAGGAIFISRLTSNVLLKNSLFKNCASTKIATSSDGVPCNGGAAFIDAYQVMTEKTSFCNCSGTMGSDAGAGSFLASGNKDGLGSYVLNSDHLGSGYNAIRLDKMSIKVENANVSNPAGTYASGDLHIGRWPLDVSVKYLFMSQALYSLGLTLSAEVSKEIHHLGFSNCTGSGMLIRTYRMQAHGKNIAVYNCNNYLFASSENGKLYVYDSWLKDVIVSGVEIISGNHFDEDVYMTLPYRVIHVQSKDKAQVTSPLSIHLIVVLRAFAGIQTT